VCGALSAAAALVAFAFAPTAQALSPPQIYWTNFASNAIGEANLDGTGVNQSFITGVDVPNG